MRSLDPAGDSFQPLGPPIRETPVDPMPLPKPTGTPSVVQMPDGKLATNLPLPPTKPSVKADDMIYAEMAAPFFRGVTTGRLRCDEVNAGNTPKADLTGKRADTIVFDDLQNLQTLTPEQEVLERALFIAVQDKKYPVDGACWREHKPGHAPPDGATWVVLRCGEIRPARCVGSWGDSSQNRHHTDYDVVGWK